MEHGKINSGMKISFVHHPMTRRWKRDSKGKIMVWVMGIWAYDGMLNKEGRWIK